MSSVRGAHTIAYGEIVTVVITANNTVFVKREGNSTVVVVDPADVESLDKSS